MQLNYVIAATYVLAMQYIELILNHLFYVAIATSFIAQFDATEYEFDVNICSPNGTVVFEALFIINPNVTVEYLSFDIILADDEIVGELSDDGDFLINGTTSPLVIQRPFQSIYLLTITIGNVLDTDAADALFNLSAFISISTGESAMPASHVTLHKIGNFVVTSIYMFD